MKGSDRTNVINGEIPYALPRAPRFAASRWANPGICGIRGYRGDTTPLLSWLPRLDLRSALRSRSRETAPRATPRMEPLRCREIDLLRVQKNGRYSFRCGTSP